MRFYVDINILGHWKHVFILLFLYISRDAVVTWVMPGLERKLAAVAIILHGTYISLIFSALAATSNLNDPRILIVLFPVLGMIIYNLIKCFWDATFNRFNKTSWYQTFIHHFLWIVLLNLGAGIISYLLAKVFVLTENEKLSIIALVVFLGLLAARHYIVAWYVSDTKLAKHTENESIKALENGNEWEVERLAHKSLGSSVASPIIGALFFLVINAGLNLIA